MSNTNNHLTERQLIEYQFKLAEESRAKEIAGHLESCGQCRRQLEKLQRKFASLDLLRGETKVSEELISQVVEQAKKQAPAKTFFLRKPVWLSAAAVLLLGLLLITNTVRKEKLSQDADRESTPSAISLVLDEELQRTTAKDSNKSDIAEALVAQTEPRQDIRDAFLYNAETKAASKEQISEKPPFAPASAIELVTLPKRDNVQLTIYNSADLTLVREKRSLILKRGWNWLQFMWANTLIDPTSLSLEPSEQKDKIEIQQLVFPARLRELGRWLIHSEVSGRVPFELTYLTSGLSWRAFYMGTLSEDEKSMQLKGYVRVTNNSGEDYENAQTRLIVGQVHMLDEIAELAKRQFPYGSPVPRLGEYSMDKEGVVLSWQAGVERQKHDVYLGDTLDGDELRKKEVIKEGLSEYFLYTIEGTETITNGWSKRLLSIDIDEVPVVNLYKYEEERYGTNVIRFLSFKNDTEHKLGETPIPGGLLKVYRNASDAGDLSYTGQSSFKYIPVNEEVELNLGVAANIVVEPKVMDYKTENYRFDSNGNIIGWDEVRVYQIEIRNTRDIAVKVEIKRNFQSRFWQLRTDDEYEKIDFDTIKFTLDMQPGTKRTLTYTLRTYHGTRQDDYRP
ncbi:MAG: DUF4139 domain-containing protein [Sedimentisphaerales bacterium]|nr:DUF4139 domain-containing protein [Sedimentisphaerales bacterium]